MVERENINEVTDANRKTMLRNRGIKTQVKRERQRKIIK